METMKVSKNSLFYKWVKFVSDAFDKPMPKDSCTYLRRGLLFGILLPIYKAIMFLIVYFPEFIENKLPNLKFANEIASVVSFYVFCVVFFISYMIFDSRITLAQAFVMPAIVITILAFCALVGSGLVSVISKIADKLYKFSSNFEYSDSKTKKKSAICKPVEYL
jgi:cellulose synthase/poly-beta-1,6-N-acetylglucosamine synthase-like glycosyltransferase